MATEQGSHGFVRPQNKQKQGTFGEKIELITNSVQVNLPPDWKVFSYNTKFEPKDLKIPIKKQLLLSHSPYPLGGYIHEGSSIFCFKMLAPNGSPITLHSLVQDEEREEADAGTVHPARPVTITLTLKEQVPPDSPRLYRLYDKMIQKVFGPLGLQTLKYEDMYLDEDTFTDSVVILAEARLVVQELITVSFRRHQTCHPILTLRSAALVFHLQSVFDSISLEMKALAKFGFNQAGIRLNIEKRLIGRKVQARHFPGCILFRIIGIAWEHHGLAENITLEDSRRVMFWFEQRHGMELQHPRQPLLKLIPFKRTWGVWQTQLVNAPAEVCFLEGINGFTDELENDYKEHVINHRKQLVFSPTPAESLIKFTEILTKVSPQIQQQFDLLELGTVPKTPLQVPGRILERESLVFRNRDRAGGDTVVVQNTNNDFSKDLKAHKFLHPVQIHTSAMIVPKAVTAEDLNTLIKEMDQVANALGIPMANSQVFWLEHPELNVYIQTIDDVISQHGDALQLILVVLTSFENHLYNSIKTHCTVQRGVLSQIISTETIVSRNPGRVQSLVADLNVSLGGEAWNIDQLMPGLASGADGENSAAGIMVIGCASFQHWDVGNWTVAMTSTGSQNCGNLFSAVAITATEVDTKIVELLEKCILAWEAVNHKLPNAIVFYREGVLRKEIFGIMEHELEAIQDLLHVMGMAKLTYINVSRKPHSTLLSRVGQGFANPPIGTVVDDVLTIAECFDFYLISHAVTYGTVRPTNYEILHDSTGFTPDEIQRFTYQLCHLHFSAGNTIEVPAVCHYATKLARFTGEVTKEEPHPNLSRFLYYLDYK